MSKKLTVLAATAHPDDIEVFCAGTLIRYVKEGHKVYMAIACTGNVGSKTPYWPGDRGDPSSGGAESRRFDRG